MASVGSLQFVLEASALLQQLWLKRAAESRTVDAKPDRWGNENLFLLIEMPDGW